jgi:hypothetical protein
MNLLPPQLNHQPQIRALAVSDAAIPSASAHAEELKVDLLPIAKSSGECVVASHSYQIDPSVYPSAADCGLNTLPQRRRGITSRAAERIQSRHNDCLPISYQAC